MNKKRVVVAFICMTIGTVIAGISGFSTFQPELINFVGAGFIMGAMIYLDGSWVKRAMSDKDKIPGSYLIRLVLYLVIGIVLLLAPIALNINQILMRIAKGYGEALMITVLWGFFSYTTVAREER